MRILTDEHVPNSFIVSLRSLNHDVLRVKDEFIEGTDDKTLLSFSEGSGRTVVTSDKRFTIIDGQRIDDHAGVIYVDQEYLKARPEDAANGVDRIAMAILPNERNGNEFYLSDWV